MADVLWGSALLWVTSFGIFEKTPEVAAYVERVTSRPAFRKAQADEAALIAAREVMQAVVIHGRKRQTVLYPVGRLPVARPGPKAGDKKAKGRGAAISIPPSTRAGRGKGSPQP